MHQLKSKTCYKVARPPSRLRDQRMPLNTRFEPVSTMCVRTLYLICPLSGSATSVRTLTSGRTHSGHSPKAAKKWGLPAGRGPNLLKSRADPATPYASRTPLHYPLDPRVSHLFHPTFQVPNPRTPMHQHWRLGLYQPKHKALCAPLPSSSSSATVHMYYKEPYRMTNHLTYRTP